jgi:hypothetical protein
MPSGTYIRTPEIREKMRKAALDRKHTAEWRMNHSKRMTGTNNPFWGRKHSEETKKRMRGVQRTRGAHRGNWKGDHVGYIGLHNWVRRWLGVVPKRCEFCGKSGLKGQKL